MKWLKNIRYAGVPIVAVETFDPAQTIKEAMLELNGEEEKTPILEWDISRGLMGKNPLGENIAQTIAPAEDGGYRTVATANPAEMLLLLLQKCPGVNEKAGIGGPVIFFHNAQNFIKVETVAQGIWNLRDVFKTQETTLVLLGPTIVLPPELQHDIVILSEKLPTIDTISAIVKNMARDVKMEVKEPEVIKACDALLGLSSFEAEQAFAMSLNKSGINLPQLWERKRQMIQQTPGLKVYAGKETFQDIGGCENVKGFLGRILRGKNPPRAIVFVDEIEKVLAGAQGDSSGVSQDYLSVLLTFMQDTNVTGCIFIGPPGAAKSAVAKAVGNEGGIPTIQFDAGGMKGSLVGESEKNMRQALKVVDAVSQGQSLFIATCNSFGNLPPELKRRFTLGTFFFDLPTDAEREKIWTMYQAKYGLDDVPPLLCDGWTGAEIRQCCDISWRLGCSLSDAAKFIVPVAVSAADTIENLRKQANGKFISASKPVVYNYAAKPIAGRKVTTN